MDGVVQETSRDELSETEPRVLRPGTHLVDLRTRRPVHAKTLVEGLEALGFSDVVLDQEPEERMIDITVFRHRFVGTRTRSLGLVDLPDLHWWKTSRVSIPVTSAPREETEPFRLLKGTTYELRFIARMKAQPNRAAVLDCLNVMGFEIDRAMALKKDMRVKGKPNASAALWYAVGTWRAPHSYTLSGVDPFCFEDVVEVKG